MFAVYIIDRLSMILSTCVTITPLIESYSLHFNHVDKMCDGVVT